MNTKTTLVLAVVAAVITGYIVLVEKPWEVKKTDEEPKSTAVALFDTKFDDADRVEIQRRDGKKLVFAKDADEKAWKLLEPIQAPATEFQVKSVLDKVGEIKYARKYGTSDADRPSEAVSGLDSPTATVRLAKGEKTLANIVVGSRLPTGKGNYLKVADDVTVKVDGKDQIVSKTDVLETLADLGDAFAGKIDTFRDKNVVKFDLNDVKQVKVEGDRNYVLVKNGDNWVIESPQRSRADKAKVEGVVRALTSLYVADFKDDAPASYKPYGLEPGRVKVTINTEKKIPPKAKPGDPNTKPADIEPSTKQVTYEVVIGGAVDKEGKQFFARLANQPWVFSLNDYTCKQLNTDLGDLQDKTIASVTTSKVKAIKAETAEGGVALTKGDKGWVDADGKAADAIAVEDLLKAVGNLKAVDFVNPQKDLVQVNWDKPRAKVTLTEEGSLNPVTVLVGPASPSGKMVYVKNAAEEPVAAVRDDEVAPLLAGPASYRDRSVMKFDRARVKKVEISQPGKETVALTQQGPLWSLVQPVAGIADRDTIRNLMQTLSNLKAKRVVGTGDKARFGLDKPAVNLAVYVEPLTANPNTQVVNTQPAPAAATKPAEATKPAASTKPAGTQPATTRPAKTVAEQIKQIEELLEFQKTNPKENPLATDMLKKRLETLKAQAQSQPAPAPAVAEKASPAPAAPASQPAEMTVLRLSLAQKDGKTYAMVDGNDTIYEVDTQVFTDATAEMYNRQIVKFETANVTEVEFAAADASIVLRKAGEDWKYVLDSVLPIDKDKVTKALDELKDVKTHRFASYKAEPAQFGLDKPACRFAVVLQGGQRTEVLISAKGPENDPDKSVYAMLAGQNGVFLLKPDQTAKMKHKVEDFEKAAGSEKAMPPADMDGPQPFGPAGRR
jgi:hypothetical protein